MDRLLFNRLCDPESKLGIARWLEGALVPGVPGVPGESVTHQRLLRTMDTVVEQADALDEALAGLLRPLIDQELSIVFYDLTTSAPKDIPRWVAICATSGWPRKATSHAR